jgi:hypothetical protein
MADLANNSADGLGGPIDGLVGLIHFFVFFFILLTETCIKSPRKKSN